MTSLVVIALLPIVLLIAFGKGLRHSGFLTPAFWPQAERLSFYILLPALFIHSLATARLDALPVGKLALTLILSILIVAAVLVLLRPAFALDGPAFTSVFQGAIRFNNYVGVTLAAGVYGAEGIALAAICNATIVPTVNILSVAVFARHGQARLTALGVVRHIVTNPLVAGSLIGVALQASGWGLPVGLEPALKSLGAAALPLGLLCVGAALEFGGARRWVGPILTSSIVKFAVMPAVTVVAGLGFGLSGPALTTALMFQALPTATSSYITARQLGGDAPLMAGIIAVQTVLALAAIPLALLAISPVIAI